MVDILHACSHTDDRRGPKRLIPDYVTAAWTRLESLGWHQVMRPQGLGETFNDAATVMYTNMGNHCTVHFEGHVRKHCSVWMHRARLYRGGKLLDAVVSAFLSGRDISPHCWAFQGLSAVDQT